MADNDQTTVNTFKSLESVFGTVETPKDAFVAPVTAPVQTGGTSTAVVVSDEFPNHQELQDDYDLARATMRTLIQKSEHALDNMLLIAAQTESARSFEVASNLLGTMASLSKDLIDLHEKVHKIKSKSGGNEKQAIQPATLVNNQTNVVFQGTATDLFDMFENEGK